MVVTAHIVGLTPQFTQPVAAGTTPLAYELDLRNAGDTAGNLWIDVYDTDTGLKLTTSPVAVYGDPGATYYFILVVQAAMPNHDFHLQFQVRGAGKTVPDETRNVTILVVPQMSWVIVLIPSLLGVVSTIIALKEGR